MAHMAHVAHMWRTCGAHGACALPAGPWYDIYSIVDYYVPTPSNNWSDPNFTWYEKGLGRALPDITCARNLVLGHNGRYKLILLFTKAILPPLVVIFCLKMISILILYMPCMRTIRKRNEKLIRTAEKRKAEVWRYFEPR